MTGAFVPDTPAVWGDVVVTRIHNPVTGKDDLRIDRADPHILISIELAQEAFDTPTDVIYGETTLTPPALSIVINARNRQLRYVLRAQHDQHSLEAELMGDSDA